MELPPHFLLFSIYLGILVYHTRHTAPIYRSKFKRSSSLPLLLHASAGIFEVAKYHIAGAHGPIVPDFFDLVACLIQSATNLILSKTLVRGDKTTRPSYQAGGLVRPFLSAAAFLAHDPFLHQASVKLLNAFVYTRILIFLGKRLRLNKVYSYSTIYAHGVFLGALMAFYESKLPGGVPLYIAAVAVITALNRYTSEYAALQLNGQRSSPGRWVIRFLIWVGLTELETLKESGKHSELRFKVQDIYTEDQG
ncbi:hypothetical protein B0T10DRAFT_419069 [Thelonectria olida]|uniref:Uncharacterized protein n=1 Tax=Thelonectria olida TaxID=1576542 RepID=A0A9P8VPG2_9HYPO|nr:hypothetical protein B0T10DRAFT_419069 [Thelonectria olida]